MKAVEIDFIVKDSLAAIEKYKEIFELEVKEQTDFKKGNNEVVFEIYGTRFHMLDENHKFQLIAPKEGSTQSIWFNVIVPDIKSTYQQAMDSGMTEIHPISHMEQMGVSNAMFLDHENYVWMIYEVHKEVSFEERMEIFSEDFE